MDEHAGVAAVELVEDRFECRVAEVRPADVGEHGDAVGVQLVEGDGDLGEGAVDVGQRERGEQSEPAGMVQRRRGGRPR